MRMSPGGEGRGMRGRGCVLPIFPTPSLPNVLILYPLRMKTEEGVADTQTHTPHLSA